MKYFIFFLFVFTTTFANFDTLDLSTKFISPTWETDDSRLLHSTSENDSTVDKKINLWSKSGLYNLSWTIQNHYRRGFRSSDPYSKNKRYQLWIDQLKIDYQQLASVFSLPKTVSYKRDDFVFIFNFVHGHNKTTLPGGVASQFWLAIYPTQSNLKKVYLHEEKFVEAEGAHLQLRYVLDQPLLLISQDSVVENLEQKQPLSKKLYTLKLLKNDSKLSAVNKDRLQTQGYDSLLLPGDFVYGLFGLQTIEGSPSWGALTGMMGEYAVAHQLASTAHLASLQTPLHIVRQYPIVLSNNTIKQKMLTTVFTTLNAKNESQIYNTLYYSCITGVLKVLKKAYSEKVDLNQFNSYSIIDYLESTGIINKKLQDKLLNVEFEQSKTKIQQLLQQESNFDQKGHLYSQSVVNTLARSLAAFILKNKITEDKWNFLKNEIVKSKPPTSNSLNGEDFELLSKAYQFIDWQFTVLKAELFDQGLTSKTQLIELISGFRSQSN